jgi:hypothetical protein
MLLGEVVLVDWLIARIAWALNVRVVGCYSKWWAKKRFAEAENFNLMNKK